MDLPELVILDGGNGTELDRRGLELRLPLWSAEALTTAPRVVQQVHEDYLRAGATAIVTNTFRTHARSLAKAGRASEAQALTTRAVQLARAARDAVNPRALVLGSVAPLEDCYHPELAPEAAVAANEHESIIGHLVDAGVDGILIETIGTAGEAEAAAAAARRLAPGRWMISFCVKSTGPAGQLIHGAPLVDVIPEVDDAVAVGVNCIPVEQVGPHIRLLRKLLPERVRIAAYANIGRADDVRGWVVTEGGDDGAYADYVEGWVADGATIVGGCCGTTPATIAAVVARLGAKNT